MSKDWDFRPLEAKLGYTFKDADYLYRALTCFPARDPEWAVGDGKLHLVGNASMQLRLKEMLYNAFPNANENRLTQSYEMLAAPETMTRIAKEMGIEAYIARQEVMRGIPDFALERGLKNLIGAIYSEGGEMPCAEFVERHWRASMQALAESPLNRLWDKLEPHHLTLDIRSAEGGENACLLNIRRADPKTRKQQGPFSEKTRNVTAGIFSATGETRRKARANVIEAALNAIETDPGLPQQWASSSAKGQVTTR